VLPTALGLPRLTEKRPIDRGEGDRILPQLPDPDIARLGRTRKAWKQQALAYFDTYAVSKAASRPST